MLLVGVLAWVCYYLGNRTSQYEQNQNMVAQGRLSNQECGHADNRHEPRRDR